MTWVRSGKRTDRQHLYYLSGYNVWPMDPSQIVERPSCSYRFAWVP